MEEAKHDKITQITGCQYRTRPIKPRLRAFWGVKKREGRMSDAIVNAVFRMSMDDFIRRLKRTDQFRHPLFAASELFDPLDPVNPFTAQGPLPIVERVWHFSRDSVPEYIKLITGVLWQYRLWQGKWHLRFWQWIVDFTDLAGRFCISVFMLFQIATGELILVIERTQKDKLLVFGFFESSVERARLDIANLGCSPFKVAVRKWFIGAQ
jgi:hypothetical protein